MLVVMRCLASSACEATNILRSGMREEEVRRGKEAPTKYEDYLHEVLQGSQRRDLESKNGGG